MYNMTGQINTREFEDKRPTLNSDGHTHHGISGLVFYASLKIILVGKDPHTGKDWRQREKSPADDEMVG